MSLQIDQFLTVNHGHNWELDGSNEWYRKPGFCEQGSYKAYIVNSFIHIVFQQCAHVESASFTITHEWHLSIHMFIVVKLTASPAKMIVFSKLVKLFIYLIVIMLNSPCILILPQWGSVV